jgi:hypothetical protein
MNPRGSIQPLGGTATTTLAVIKIVNAKNEQHFAREIVLRNDDPTNNLLVSFDGGTTFETLKPTVERRWTSYVNSFCLKSSAATVAYSGHALVAS